MIDEVKEVIMRTMNDINEDAYKLLQRGELNEGITHRCQQETSMKTSLEFSISDQKWGPEPVSCFIGTFALNGPCFDQLQDT